MENLNKTISASMVRKILLKRGLRSYKSKNKPFLTKRMRSQRIEFSKQYSSLSKEDWSKFIFSDESYIQINPDQIMNRVRRTSLENPLLPKYTCKSIKYPFKVMVWGCFNHAGPGRIHVCDGNMNSEYYLEVL